MEQTKKDEIQDLINAAYQNIGNATKQNDGMTAVTCLLGSIAHSLIALVEMEAERLGKNETGI